VSFIKAGISSTQGLQKVAHMFITNTLLGLSWMYFSTSVIFHFGISWAMLLFTSARQIREIKNSFILLLAALIMEQPSENNYKAVN
jgi:hypothetical protein